MIVVYMLSQGESSIATVLRTGKRLKEFDSLFYMRDSIRRQYILDRYLKRLPKGDVKLNTAFQTRIEIGTDNGDDEDLQEAYQRGWIDYQDILKYYKPSSEGVMPPNLLKRQDIIMKNLVKKTSLPKPPKVVRKDSVKTYKKIKINFDDDKERDAYFEKFEKKEKVRNTKTDATLLEKGFSKMKISNEKKKNILSFLKKQTDKLKKANIKLTSEPGVVSKKIPMWKKEQIAENYKNERYKKSEEKRDAYFSRGRLTQGLTQKEQLKKVEEDLELLGLYGLKRNILETKIREEKKRPTIFLDENRKPLKRKASGSSASSSRKSSVSGYVPSPKNSSGSSRKSSVSGYSSPASSTKSEKELWSDSY